MARLELLATEAVSGFLVQLFDGEMLSQYTYPIHNGGVSSLKGTYLQNEVGSLLSCPVFGNWFDPVGGDNLVLCPVVLCLHSPESEELVNIQEDWGIAHEALIVLSLNGGFGTEFCGEALHVVWLL